MLLTSVAVVQDLDEEQRLGSPLQRKSGYVQQQAQGIASIIW